MVPWNVKSFHYVQPLSLVALLRLCDGIIYIPERNYQAINPGFIQKGKTNFPDISLTQIQISLTKTIGDPQNIFSPKLLFTMRQ